MVDFTSAGADGVGQMSDNKVMRVAAGAVRPATRGLLAVLAGTLLAVGISVAARHAARPPVANDATEARNTDARELPRSIKPLSVRQFGQHSPEAMATAHFMSDPPSNTPIDGWVICHFVRLYGRGPIGNSRFPDGDKGLQLLLDERVCEREIGTKILLRTRNGLRFTVASPDAPIGPKGESHRDLCLATFGECGLPLSTPVQCESRAFTIKDILDDSIANFSLKEREIAWTAIAYVLYLQPDHPWRNRYGDQFQFDDLANEILGRQLSTESCGGAHLLYALTLLARVDQEARMLSSATRRAVHERLKACVGAASLTQRSDGSWAGEWWNPESHVLPAFRRTTSHRLLITGHVLEWMEYLPTELQPQPAVYQRAARWLVGALPDFVGPGMRPGDFCPWTHSVCALKNLTILTTAAAF